VNETKKVKIRTLKYNKDPIRTQNAKKVLIKDHVLKIRTLLEAVG